MRKKLEEFLFPVFIICVFILCSLIFSFNGQTVNNGITSKNETLAKNIKSKNYNNVVLVNQLALPSNDPDLSQIYVNEIDAKYLIVKYVKTIFLSLVEQFNH